MDKPAEISQPAAEPSCTGVPGLPQCPHPLHTAEGAARLAAGRARLDAWWGKHLAEADAAKKRTDHE